MPKVSLVIPLVDFLVAWKAIPNVSQWVLRTVQKGHRIQLGHQPPRFNGVLATVEESVQAWVMEQEVQSSSKGGHRMYSSSRENFWVLQAVFHSSDEGWGVVSHFRSASRAYDSAHRDPNQGRGLLRAKLTSIGFVLFA